MLGTASVPFPFVHGTKSGNGTEAVPYIYLKTSCISHDLCYIYNEILCA